MNPSHTPDPLWNGDRRAFLKTATSLTAFPLALASAPHALAAAASSSSDAPLPPGARAVWDLALAYHETTPTRERICVNGLWRWQPAQAPSDAPPGADWGFFKVPGCWPGFSDYMQKESQAIVTHPAWPRLRLREITTAWYQREIQIPKDWARRRITLDVEVLNSFAKVFIDGKPAGEMRFPGGELDLTAALRPGARHLLSLCVQALPLNAVLQSFIDTANARTVKGSVARRGLCGDVYLSSSPAGARITDVTIATSVRQGELTLDVALIGLESNKTYELSATVLDGGRETTRVTSDTFTAARASKGRIAIRHAWLPEKLWDIHTPQNQYELTLDLREAYGGILDTTFHSRFGFREFWIEGRDFYLNGSRIFLSAIPFDNAQVSAHMATYAKARETMERMRAFGINAVYTHNYGCQPGDHLAFNEILRAADDAGMLVSFSQPHFSHYDWKAADADAANGYARHAEYYVCTAQHHPSVVMYSMSHNGCGYSGDMDPELIDGIHDARDSWASNNTKRALRAEAIVKKLDPARIVYHHAGGNIGSMHTINFYPNFVPIQELSDWFSHWSERGVKPLFTCEYGAPFTWDWAMYRGWYKGERTFGSAQVPWEFCLAEWNAQFLGDAAFKISEAEKANLRWEAKKFAAGQVWFRWDYPHQLGSSDFSERDPIWARYTRDNWRAFRTLGVSANSPWEYSILWRARPGVDRSRRELKTTWELLQWPGFSPDFIGDQYEKVDSAFRPEDWVPGEGAKALIENNGPVLAYIGGKYGAVTGKDHNFTAGETVQKAIVLVNNSRNTLACKYVWHFDDASGLHGSAEVELQTGEIKTIPFQFKAPAAPAERQLTLNARFDNGRYVQNDAFTIDILPPLPQSKSDRPVALFDPLGETAKLLAARGVSCRAVEAGAELGDEDVLIIGKGALSAAGPAPDLRLVREGLKVIVFEQTAEALEKRLGFRVQEYGLRQVFPRLAGHPALAGLGAENLRDWRGAATLTPPARKFAIRDQRLGATVKWCDITVTRLWRGGNRGNVASVLIEKPACGDFTPLLDGGFSLQYSPLMEYREGKGMILFCQLDVTARTESDPAAALLVQNILDYSAAWQPAPPRQAVFVGEAAGKAHLERAGFALASYQGGQSAGDQVLVVSPGGGNDLAPHAAELVPWLASGGRVLALGLDGAEAKSFLPLDLRTEQREHIATCFEAFPAGSPLAGVGPADVHNRAPRKMPLVTGGAVAAGDGVLAHTESGNAVFCQLLPWQFDAGKQSVKRTFRRASFTVSRLLGNLGVPSATPLLERFASAAAQGDQRWLKGFYLDTPEEWDDPYRSFRW